MGLVSVWVWSTSVTCIACVSRGFGLVVFTWSLVSVSVFTDTSFRSTDSDFWVNSLQSLAFNMVISEHNPGFAGTASVNLVLVHSFCFSSAIFALSGFRRPSFVNSFKCWDVSAGRELVSSVTGLLTMPGISEKSEGSSKQLPVSASWITCSIAGYSTSSGDNSYRQKQAVYNWQLCGDFTLRKKGFMHLKPP